MVSDILCLGLRKIILIYQAMLLTLSFVNCQTGYIVLSKFLALIKTDSPHTHTHKSLYKDRTHVIICLI